nr:ribonuclease H-like domain-containing protein [Tanacetum cinerariifolium]
ELRDLPAGILDKGTWEGVGLELVETRLVMYQQNENVFEEDIKLLKLDVMLGDNALVELRKKFEKAKNKRDDLKLTLEKFQTFSKNLSKLLESQISDKTGLGYDSQVFDSESITNVVSVESHTYKPRKDMSKPLRPDAPIIEDWTFDSEDESEIEFVSKQKKPSFVLTTEHVKTPRASVKPVDLNKLKTLGHTIKSLEALKYKGVINSGCSRHMTGNICYLSDFKEINGGYVAFGGNLKGGKITGKDKIKTGKLDFDDVYFVQGKQHRASCKSKPVSSVNHPLQRLHMDLFRPTFVKSLNKKSYCLVVTDDYSSIGFMRPFRCPVTILNTLDPLEKFDGKADEGFLVGYSVNSKAFRVFNSKTRIVKETLHINFLENQPNVAGSGPKWLFDIDTLTQSMNYQPVVARNQPIHNVGIKENLVTDAAFDVQENENDVHVSPDGSDKTVNKKHDKKDKRADKGKSLVYFSTGIRDLRDEFEEFSFNNTNSFNTASPSDTAISPNFKISVKSSFVDLSQYHDDLDMPALEDIVHSNDEEDVGAEAGFSNLETNIYVSPIPTTRVYKDHPVTQIIGDFTLAPQTMSMARMVKEQGGLNQINDEDFHTYPNYPDKVYKVVKALYGSHQALRAWYETLANYLLDNGFQRGKIDQTLFIKKQKGSMDSKSAAGLWYPFDEKDGIGVTAGDLKLLLS